MMYIIESGLQLGIHNWIDYIPVIVDTDIALDCFTLLLARHLADVSCHISEAIRDVKQTNIAQSAVCCNTYSLIEIHQEA